MLYKYIASGGNIFRRSTLATMVRLVANSQSDDSPLLQIVTDVDKLNPTAIVLFLPLKSL